MILFRRADGQERRFGAESLLAMGFLAVILVGTVLLMLPAAARDGRSIGLFNSLFTATSAVCVTGLVAVDTGTTFSLFGQAVLKADLWAAVFGLAGLGGGILITRVFDKKLGAQKAWQPRLLGIANTKEGEST